MRPGGLQSIEHPPKQGVVVAVGNMDDHFRVRVDRLHGVVTAVDELREVGETVDRHPTARIPGVHRPKHAVIGFVADLDPFGMDPRHGQSGQNRGRVDAHGLGQLGHGVVGPSRGLGLVSGIGPGITVMKINQDTKSHALSLDRLGHHIRLVAPAARRIDPNPQADGVDALFLKDGEAPHGNAGAVLEGTAISDHLG